MTAFPAMRMTALILATAAVCADWQPIWATAGSAGAAYDIQFAGEEADPIQPLRIFHRVEEIRDGAELRERYNYIVYEFERDGLFATGRTYLDDIDTVSIYGPYAGRGSTREVGAPAFEAAVMAYFQRRFNQIDRLSRDENSPAPYVTVWRRRTGE
jgi:hypothetical protein